MKGFTKGTINKVAGFNVLGKWLGMASVSLVLSSAGVIAPSASAQETAPARQAEARIDYAIPAQNLNSALLAFADRAGVQVFFDSARFAGLSTGGVNGRLTLTEALDKLLAGSGVTYQVGDNHHIRLTLATPAAQSPAKLKTVVVTASGFEQIITDAPASISVVTPEELKKRPITDFTDVIRDVPGASITNGEGRNVDISLRGMPAGYTLILIDGKRQNLSGIARNGNNNVRQSFMPPASAIERVEIIRGPMSTLYGADAMGGVINVITKKVSKEWGGEFSADYTAQEEKNFGNSRGVNFFVNGPVVSDKVGVQITGREQLRDEDLVPRGDPQRTNRNLTGRVWITPNSNHDIMLEKSHEYFNMYAWVTGRSPGQLWEQTTRRDAWSVSHTGRWSTGTSEVIYQKEDATKGNVNADNWTLDAKYMLPWELGGSHFTTVGIQFTSNTVDSWAIEDVNGTLIDVIEQKNQAFFAEDEWSMTDTVALTLGARFDDPEDFDSHVSPRSYLVWKTTDHITLKGGVATGFKAPRADYVAPGLVTESENATTGALAYTYSNPDMKPETSINYEIAAIWEGANGTNVSLTLFQTDFKDKLDSETHNTVYATNGGALIAGDVVDPQGYCADALANLDYACSWSERINIDKAMTEGIELTLDTPLTRTLRLKTAYTWLDSEEQSGANKGQPLSGSPEHNLTTTLDWQINGKLNTWLSYAYRTELRASNRPAPGCFETESCPSLGLLDLGATIAVNKDLTVNTGIYNLTNRKWDNFDTKGSVEDGRRLYVRASYTF